MKKLNWVTWLKEGDQYLKTATPKGDKSKFNNEILYNVYSMALESYIMAILDFHTSLPANHTYTDLVLGLETVYPLDPSLKERVLKYENIQSICSIDKFQIQTATDEELIDLDGAIREIHKIAHEVCVAEV